MGQLKHPVLGTLEVPDRLLQPENREELEQNLLQLAADTLPQDEAWYQTFTKQFGRTASETARGAADIVGMDKPEDDYVNEFVRRARAIQNPKAAVAGQLFGAVGDVPSYLFGGFARKGAGFLEDIITRGISIGGVSGGLMPVYEMFGDDRITNAAVGAALGGALGGSAGLVLRKLGYKTEEELADALRNASPEERSNIEQQIDEVLQLESPQAFDARKREEEVLSTAQTRAEELQKEAEVQQIRERGDAVGEEVQADRVAREFETNLAEQRNKTLNMQMRQTQDEINAGRKAEYDSQVAEITQRVRQERQAELKATMQSKIVPDSMRMPIEDAVAKAKKNVTTSQNRLKYIQKQIDAIESGKATKGTKGRGINMLRSEQERLQRDLTTDQAFLQQAEEVKAARKESVMLNKRGTSPVVEQRVAEQVAKLQQPQALEPVQVPVQQPVQVPREQLQAVPEAFAGAPRPAPTAPPNVGTSSGRFSQGQVQRIAPEAPVSPSQPRSAQPSATPQGVVEPRPEFKRAGGVDRAFGAISTRLRDAFPTVFQGLRNIESQIAALSNVPVNKSKPFFDELKRLRPEARNQIKGHLYNGRFDEAKELMGPVMRKSFNDIRKELQNIRQLANAAGMDIPFVENYFPRTVKDLKGLREALGRGPAKGEVEKVLQEYRNKNGVSVIPPEIEADLINKVVRGIQRRKEVQLGAKGKRTLGEVPEELLQFYDEPAEALTRYFQRMGRDIPINKFMGNHAVRDTEGNLVLEGNDGSIGRMIADMRMKGNLSADEEAELLDILSARFIQGEKAMNKFLAGGRDLGYIGTIGNIASAIVNLGDLGTSAGLHGLKNTIAAMFGKTGGNKYDVIDMGIDHTVANELRDNKTTARWLNTVFKASQFQRLDRLAKNTSMNAAMRKNEALAQSEKGKEQLRKKWGAAYGDEVEVLIRDLENEQVTPRTQLLAFHELSDMQPISLSEASQYYLNNPDMRLLYMLKSFTLKQYDIVRREIVREYAKGNKMDAAKKAATLLGYMTAANVGTQTVQDFALGRDIEPEAIPNKALWTLLGVFGLNKYVIDRYLKQGDVSGALQAYVFPPMPLFDSAGKLIKETAKAVEGEEYNLAKASRALPVVGPVIYSFYGGGAENFNTRQEAELWNKKLKSMGYEVD